jgi:ATP-binding cassette, subfamily C, bacterial
MRRVRQEDAKEEPMAEPGTKTTDIRTGLSELAAARAASRQAVAVAFLFSAFVNLLMLTAPLYMLQVYDRVLVSRSEETLLALTLLMAFLFLVMGVLDHARGRIMARVGARLQQALDARVLSAAIRRLTVAPQDTPALAAQKDLDAIARFWASMRRGRHSLPLRSSSSTPGWATWPWGVAR